MAPAGSSTQGISIAAAAASHVFFVASSELERVPSSSSGGANASAHFATSASSFASHPPRHRLELRRRVLGRDVPAAHARARPARRRPRTRVSSARAAAPHRASAWGTPGFPDSRRATRNPSGGGVVIVIAIAREGSGGSPCRAVEARAGGGGFRRWPPPGPWGPWGPGGPRGPSAPIRPPRGRAMQVVVRGCAEDHQTEETAPRRCQPTSKKGRAKSTETPGFSRRRLEFERAPRPPPPPKRAWVCARGHGGRRSGSRGDETARHARRFRGGMPPGRVPREGPKPGVKGHTCLHYSFRARTSVHSAGGSE